MLEVNRESITYLKSKISYRPRVLEILVERLLRKRIYIMVLENYLKNVWIHNHFWRAEKYGGLIKIVDGNW